MTEERRPGQTIAGYEDYQTSEGVTFLASDGRAYQVPVYRASNSSPENVTAGKPKIGGAVFIAPLGTALPTDSTTDLAAAFTGLGYASEDGLVNEENTETEAIHAWGGDVVLVLGGEHTDTYNWTLLETLDANVQKFVRGADNVTVGTGGAMSVAVNGASLTEQVLVVEMLWRGRQVRHVIPRGVITEKGEVTYSDDSAVGYQVTVTALPDSDGNTHYEYIAAP